MSNSFVKSELKSDNFDSKEIFLGKHCQEGYCQYTDNIYKCKEVVRMQKLMSEAHKSELAGIIAVGLAHDFNNMLCVANCKIEQILCKNGHDQYLKQKLEDVLFVLKQSSNLVRDLLVFCKKGETQDVILDVNVTIQKTVEILKKTFAKDIIFNLNFANDLPKILINETKFIQVLFNISLNASDAMPNGGKIEISTNRCHENGKDFVMVKFKDSGIGMKQEVISKIFTPLFTTKGSKGTGLGLPIVYNVINCYNGDIRCKSTPGEGTEFLLLFPEYKYSRKILQNVF